ncbi:MAG TPA: hypothetical protein VMJ10_09450 [Kofleriaceae bacterium]|nr:hypothetical protein [Kofleriaceae bacterium]
MRRTITLDLAVDAKSGNELAARGGVFAAGAPLRLDEECNLVLRAGQEELRLVARAVIVNDHGSGLEVVGLTSALRDQISAFARVASFIAVMRDTPAHRRGEATMPMMPVQPQATLPPPPRGAVVERVRNVRYDDEPRFAAGSTPPLTKPTPNVPIEPPVAYAPTQDASTLAAAAEAARRAAADDENK